jgi:hypothetical protein
MRMVDGHGVDDYDDNDPPRRGGLTMIIDLRPVPPEIRRDLAAALGEAHEAIAVLLTALRASREGELADVPMDKLGVVELVTAIIRGGAARTDVAGRATLRPILIALANTRDDLAAIPPPAGLDDPDSGDWTPDLPEKP